MNILAMTARRGPREFGTQWSMNPVLRAVLPLLIATAAFAGEDSWAKVRELKSGTELRIYRVESKDALLAKLDRAGDESLIVITKSEQLSIPKEEIERIEFRPVQTRHKGKDTRVERKVAPKGAEVSGNTIPGATTSVTTGLHRPGKGDFETIYRRTPDGKN
jgi:hypothetical protein